LDAPADVEEQVKRGEQLLEAVRLLLSWFRVHAATTSEAERDARRARSGTWLALQAGKETAEGLRAVWGLEPEQPIVDIEALVESLGFPVERRDLPENIHGITIHDETDGVWRAVVFVNSVDYWTRQRYSVAHELCHLLYRDGNSVIVDRKGEAESTDVEEIRAESFARHLLAPDRAVRAHLKQGHARNDVELVAGFVLGFGVSRTVTLRAFRDIGSWVEGRLLPLASGGQSVGQLMANAGFHDEWTAACQDQHRSGPSAMLLGLALDAFKEQVVSASLVAQILDRDEADVGEELAARGWAPSDGA
jgi:hypothetical protein